MNILNLTQHPASAEQRMSGVVDLNGADLLQLRELLTFDHLPSREVIKSTAETIAGMAAAETERGIALQAMIGGAPFLMSALESALREQGIEPVYAFSRRESVEKEQTDGSIRKTNVFRHLGFVPA